MNTAIAAVQAWGMLEKQAGNCQLARQVVPGGILRWALVQLVSNFSVAGVGRAGKAGGQLPAGAAAIPMCHQGLPPVGAQLAGASRPAHTSPCS